MILLFNHINDTGLVKKSLQPAAKAATRSLWRDDAVNATIITEERNGVVAEVRESVVLESVELASEGVFWPSVPGVVG